MADETGPSYELRTLFLGQPGESVLDKVCRYYGWVLLVIIIAFEPMVRWSARAAERGKSNRAVMVCLWFVIVNGALLAISGAAVVISEAIRQAYFASLMMLIAFVFGLFMFLHGLRAVRRVRRSCAQYEIRKMAAMDVE